MKTYIYLLLVCIPVYYLRIGSLPTNIFELFVALGVAVALAYHIKVKQLPTLSAKVTIPLVLMLAGLLLGVLFSLDKLATLGIIKSWFIVPVAVYWLASVFFQGEDVRFVAKALTLSGVLVALYVSLQWLGFIGPVGYQVGDVNYLRYVAEGRASGFFESPNYAAMYLAPIFFLSLQNLSSWRDPRLIGSLLMLFAVIATGSRGAMLAIIVTTVALFIYYKKGLKKALLAVGVIIILLAITYYRLSPQLGDGDINRLEYYRAAVVMMQTHPVAGIGAGQFYENFIALCSTTELGCNADSSAFHPHSLYLNLILSGGALLFVGFVFLVTHLYRQLFHCVRNAATAQHKFRLAASGAAILVILLHGLVDTTYFKNDLAVVFWLLVLVCHTYSGHSVPKLGKT